MILYIQMRWNIEGRLPLEKIWDLELAEGEAVQGSFKVIGMYKVAAQRRVIAIVEVESADELDRNYMARLPLREYLELEVVWVLRSFESFLADCKTEFQATVAS